MRKLAYLIGAFSLVLFSACEKEDNNTTEDPTNNGGGGGNSSLTNNVIVVGAQSADLNMFTAHQPTDVNTGKEYIDIFVFKDSPANRENYIQFTLNEVPTSSMVLNWQSGSSAPGDLKADEFTMFPKVADTRWFGVYSTDGFETTGELNAEVNGSKLTLWFEDIELADNFISTNVTTRENVSGKLTFNLSDLQNLTDRPSDMKSLVDE